MKKDIHPEYHAEARVVCGCGNSFVTGATTPLIKTDICSACHPFFTGEQRIVDTAGQVERYMKRLEKKEEIGKSEDSDAGGKGAKEAGRSTGKGGPKTSPPKAAKGDKGRRRAEGE